MSARAITLRQGSQRPARGGRGRTAGVQRQISGEIRARARGVTPAQSARRPPVERTPAGRVAVTRGEDRVEVADRVGAAIALVGAVVAVATMRTHLQHAPAEEGALQEAA